MTTTVKFSRTVLFLAAMLLAGVVTSVQAQTPIILQFGEDGKGFLSIGSPPTQTQFPGTLLPDPTHSGLMALTYILPTLSEGRFITVGTAGIAEPEGGLSEVLRFTDATGNLSPGVMADRLIFYSELETPPSDSDLADKIGIPLDVRGATILAREVPFPECAPGCARFSFPLGNNITIAGTSDLDVVPEPSSFLLLGTGLLGIVGYGRRKWNLLRQS